MIESRYSGFDVMAAHEEWDDHTRQVIAKRMLSPGALQFFTPAEEEALAAALGRLLGESDSWILAKVLEQIDQRLAEDGGDGYRPEGQPPDQLFWREGLTFLGEGFLAKSPDGQDGVLHKMAHEQQPFFKSLLREALSSYCSLPPVWSFMGYAGPAYPRGYVRIELGLRDPWEAKLDEK